LAILGGTRIGYFGGDPLKLMEDIQVLKPTMLAAVPRILIKVYDRIMAGVSQASPTKRWLFNKAVADKTYNLETYGTLTHSFYDKIIFKKIRAIFGGELL
jgi:long-chain acyl-CoA synthetase